jgi:hypothetical protein
MMSSSAFIEWCRLAVFPSVIRRSAIYAVVVGAILIAINHGDTILNGSATVSTWVKVFVTPLVPYAVSTLSSVGTLRGQARQTAARQRETPDRRF